MAKGTVLVVADDPAIVGVQRLAAPEASIQVKDTSGLLREVRIAREEPTAGAPGPERIAIQEAPECSCPHD